LDVALMEKHKVYYKGEGDGFPKFESWWVLWIQIFPWLVLAPKVLHLYTNQLIVWFVQIRVSDYVLVFLVPSWSSSTPLYPSKCCEPGNVPRLLSLLLFSTWIHIWVPQGVESASSEFPHPNHRLKFITLDAKMATMEITFTTCDCWKQNAF
jgi:hypothetical protein